MRTDIVCLLVLIFQAVSVNAVTTYMSIIHATRGCVMLAFMVQSFLNANLWTYKIALFDCCHMTSRGPIFVA